MKSLGTLVALVALLVALAGVQNAHAQLELMVGGGVNSPLGEYGDQANVGYALTAGIGYRVMPMLSLGAELGYNGNKAPDEFTEALGTGINMSTSIFSYTAVAKMMYPVGKFAAFGKGMIGNYRGSARVESPLGDASVSNTDFGYGIGGGFMVGGGGMSSFLFDVTYHRIAFDGADTATSFLTFNVGAVWMFDLFSKDDDREDLEKDLERVRH